MLDRLFTTRLPDGKAICISPLAQVTYDEMGVSDVGDADGYFIYEYDPADVHCGIELLAKAASYHAAMRLADIYLAAMRFPSVRNK